MLSNFALLFYAVASIYFGRKNPYFYLIFPFALLQGPSAFISQDVLFRDKLIFSNTSTVFSETLLVVLLLIVSLLPGDRKISKPIFGNKLIFFYLAYISMLFFYSVFKITSTMEVILTVRPFLYIVLGYFIWKRIWSSGTREQFNSFLKIILISTIFIDIIYILNSSHLVEFYDSSTVYATIKEGRDSFYRDFKAIPVFGLLSFTISLILITQRAKIFSTWILLANLFIFPFVILFTFTRSYLILVILNIAVVVILNNLVKHSTVIKHVFRSSLIIVSLVLIWFTANTLFSSAFSYFEGRVAEAIIKKAETDNVSIRFDYMTTAKKILNDKNLSMTGEGFIRESYPEMERVGAFAADSTITLIFLHTGYFGVVLIYLIWIFFTIQAFVLYKKNNDWILQYIAAYGFSTIIVSTLMGTDIRGGLLSMMLFALLIVLRYDLWNKQKKIIRKSDPEWKISL